jgi:N-acetylglucosamine-6-phosphate deacetylase
MSDLRGFVDLQVNGFNGVGFSDVDLDEAAATTALHDVIRDGTAIVLPTMLTADEAVYARNLPLLSRIISGRDLSPHCPGLHLEGPFLSPSVGAAGAHNPLWTRQGDVALLERLQEWADGRIRLLTIAPGIPGALSIIQRARQLNIVVSLGHHVAHTDELKQAVDAGATLLTHLGNGLPHMIDRHRNPLIDGLAEDRLQAMIIGDGHHVPWNLLSVMLRAKGLDQCCLVSDAAPIANNPPGTYTCMGSTGVISANGRLANPANGYLLGSSYTIRRVVNATQAALHLSDGEMYQLAVTNPQRFIGLPQREIGDLPRNAAGEWQPQTSFLPDSYSSADSISEVKSSC